MTDPWSTPVNHAITCRNCEQVRSASEMGSASYAFWGGNDPDTMVLLLRCDTCNYPHLMERDFHGQPGDELRRLWPNPRRTLSYAIPDSIREEHQQAALCLESRAYTAAVVMVRRTLEGVCADHGFKPRNLAQGLEQLREAGLLDGRLVEWSQALRVLGNQGAHFTGKQVERQDALDAMSFCEALLDYTYVLTSRFNEFKARQARNAADPLPGDGGPDASA